MRKRNHMISQLRDQIRNTENNIKSEVSKGLKQSRAKDRKKIQQLKSDLEEIHKTAQESQGQVIQQEVLIRKLQDKLSSTERKVVNITVFQAQALEV